MRRANCLRFVAFSTARPAGRAYCTAHRPGAVAIVSQSGATASEIATFAATQAIGVSHMISTGNEAMIDTTAMAAAVLEDRRVWAVAMFVESIRNRVVARRWPLAPPSSRSRS